MSKSTLTSKRPKSIETEVKDDAQALLWSKNNAKAFAILILNALTSANTAVKIGIAK